MKPPGYADWDELSPGQGFSLRSAPRGGLKTYIKQATGPPETSLRAAFCVDTGTTHLLFDLIDPNVPLKDQVWLGDIMIHYAF
jgi:hypothetical protein